MPLRPYQQEQYDQAKKSLMEHKRILLQAPTGSGKTPIFSEITERSFSKGNLIWIVVPRNELVDQASAHLRKWNVPHSLIAKGLQESRAFNVHIVSLMTLKRRYNKIKRWPKLIIIDEAHINYDAQLEIIQHAPDDTYFIGFTATPERLDGRGLSDIYGHMIPGKSIPWLMEREFLTKLRYFAPRVEGINKVKRKGTEFDATEIDQIIEEKNLYGDSIEYYEKYATIKKNSISIPGTPTIKLNQYYNRGKPALGFFRTVKEAYKAAERFRDAGYLFYCIEGNMKKSERDALIKAHREGKIDGLTNCEIATYGLDIPRIEYGFSLRPTLSRSLYFQKIGRILRPFSIIENGNLKYKKEDAIFFDHANLIEDHQNPDFPGVPLFYIDNLKWNFTGKEKRKAEKTDKSLKLCPHLDMMYCDKPTCRGCKFNTSNIEDIRKPIKTVDAEFDEIKPVKLSERPEEEKREFIDNINDIVNEYKSTGITPGPVGKMLKLAKEFGYQPLWVYWRMIERNRFTVDVTLLSEIARQAGYKKGWVYFKKTEIEKKIRRNHNDIDKYAELFF